MPQYSSFPLSCIAREVVLNIRPDNLDIFGHCKFQNKKTPMILRLFHKHVRTATYYLPCSIPSLIQSSPFVEWSLSLPLSYSFSSEML